MSLRPGKRVAAEPEASSDDPQHLELEGTLSVLYDGKPVGKISPDFGTYHLGAWIGNRHFASCKGEGDDGKVQLGIPFGGGDPDLLKLKAYAVVVDPESQEKKAFPLAAGLCCMRKLVGDGKARVVMKNIYAEKVECVAELKVSKGGLDVSCLRRSALYGTKEFSDCLGKMGGVVDKAMGANKLRVAKPAGGFIKGITFLSGGGSEELGIPPVPVHYGILSRLVGMLDRPVPHAILAEGLQRYLVNTGVTIDQILACDDEALAHHASGVCNVATYDSGIFPYQRDANVGMDFSISIVDGGLIQARIGLGLSTSEDIGNPYGASSHIGVEDRLGACEPILGKLEACGSDTSMFQVALRALQCQGCQVKANHLVCDDCETSSCMCKMNASTVEKGDMSVDAFKREIKGGDFLIFKNWTDACYERCSEFYTRVQGILRDKKLRIELTIGLAGAASAGTGGDMDSCKVVKPRAHMVGHNLYSRFTGKTVDEEEGLGGHCFMVSQIDCGSGPQVDLLEGTTKMKTLLCTEKSPQYTVTMVENGVECGKKVLDVASFMTIFSKAISLRLQVCGALLGGSPSPALVDKLQGHSRSTMVIPSLKSFTSKGSPKELPFYKLCAFTGLDCGVGDVGAMPVGEKVFDGELSAGCLPTELDSMDLRGVSVVLTPEQVKLGSQILDEIWVPNGTNNQFKAIMDSWMELDPLVDTCKDLQTLRAPGVEYYTVSIMESPCSPEYVDAMYMVKSCAVRLANEINAKVDKSDGIFGVPHKIGTGVSVVMHVPLRSSTLTYMSSLKEAQKQLGWKVK